MCLLPSIVHVLRGGALFPTLVRAAEVMTTESLLYGYQKLFLPSTSLCGLLALMSGSPWCQNIS